MGLIPRIFSGPLNFRFAISHGEFMPSISEMMIREEVIKCGLQDSTTLEYTPVDAVSLSWIGDCYDETGGKITKPSVDVDGRLLSFDSKVFGSIRARYTLPRASR